MLKKPKSPNELKNITDDVSIWILEMYFEIKMIQYIRLTTLILFFK